MPHHVDGVLLHTMSGSELSHVRTELERRRILTSIPPQPVQTNCQPAPHRYLGNVLVPTHRQVNVPTSPVGMNTRRCLGCLHQQQAQQRTALFTDVPQSLLASTGVLTRNHPHIVANLLTAWKAFPSSNDQHEGECRKRTHARMCHQPHHVGSLPGFPLDGCG